LSSQLKKSYKIWKLAKDLGIRPSDNPVLDILHYCKKKVKKFLNDFPDCKTLTTLLDCIAAKVGTSFEEIHTDQDLYNIKNKYLKRGEKIFVALEDQLSGDVYGITFRLTQRKPWELQFVSIIDCRSDNSFRSYYTKWHEISHILVLTDQMRLSFTRTLHLSEKDPEELLIDIIAGHFGFYPPLVNDYAKGEISFEEIENLRQQLCPDASQQSSLIGFVNAWPEPCLLLYCQPAFKKNEQAQLLQERFDFREIPMPVLRATKVTLNDSAREADIRIFNKAHRVRVWVN